MEFKIRSTGTLVHVILTEGSTNIDLGLLDISERICLAEEFQAAIDELLYGITNE